MRTITTLLAAAALLACSSSASPPDSPVQFGAQRAQISAGALTRASSASPVAAVAQLLRGRGASDATVASLRQVAQSRGQTGLLHLRVEQEVAGLRVAGASLKAALNARGEVVHVVDDLVPVGGGRVLPAAIGEADALRAALAAVHPGLKEVPGVDRRQGNTTTFTQTPFFYSAPSVERVAIAMTSGALTEGFVVETWSLADNRLHLTTIGGDGSLVGVEARTSEDRYNVFAKDPVTTPQAIVNGPGSGNVWSPIGWLFAGAQRSIDIAGNNVHAYLDANADNAPDAGGTTISNGEFLAVADLTVEPTTPTNRDVAVQNLFYLNNVIHDALYQYGFTETTGNFQEDNFGKGGHDSDSVRAEAQDGGGTDNANFATPTDGRRPRMQMYLWVGKGVVQLVVDAPASIAGTYPAASAEFGPPLSKTGVTGDLVLANDGTAPTADACQALVGDMTGKIVVVDRGTCTFTAKVKNAQVAGAAAVVVVNTRGDSLITMGGTDATITIPSILVGLTDGTKIEAGLPGHGTARLTDPPPIHRDGDLDSDIVWHEYGHGLTWRMIGSMQGPLSGAIGEGMSDVLAIVINENDVVGEYAFNDPVGIRRFPYHNYPLTYGSVTGSEVHNDGEVYAAIGWRLFEIFQQQELTKDDLLAMLVDGMNYTPQSPAFEDMRDGILASVAQSGSGRECLVWQAFARYGVGVGAHAQYSTGNALSIGDGNGSPPANVRVTESFVLPPQCATP